MTSNARTSNLDHDDPEKSKASMAPHLGRIQPVASGSRAAGLPAFEALPLSKDEGPAASLSALNDASLLQFNLPLLNNVDAVESVRCYQLIEQMLGNRPNQIVQLVTPSRSIANLDIAYYLAWAGAILLGKRILLIDASPDCTRADRGHQKGAGHGSGRQEDIREDAITQQVMARLPVIEQLRKMKQLFDVVAGRGTVEEAIIKEASCGLFVATLDTEKVVGRGVVDSRDIRILLDGLRPRFDMVLIAPGSVMDKPLATVLSNIVDGSVVVLQAARTRGGVARRAMQALQSGRTPVLGIIFSDKRNYQPSWLQRFWPT